jgi:hypothetical protein
MPIDPVILLTDELHAIELALSRASQAYNQSGRREDGEVVNTLLARTKGLFEEIMETVPTSAMGAAALVMLAGQRLPFSHARHAARLHNIADRLAAGCRDQKDIIWLRAMHAALLEGIGARDGGKTAQLLDLAIRGACRPVMVFRSVTPVSGPAGWRETLTAL